MKDELAEKEGKGTSSGARAKRLADTTPLESGTSRFLSYRIYFRLFSFQRSNSAALPLELIRNCYQEVEAR